MPMILWHRQHKKEAVSRKFWGRERAEPEGDTQSGQEVEVDAAILRAWLNGEGMSRENAMNIPTLSGCINKIANTVASVPIKLYKREKDKVTEVEKDERLPLLNAETGDTLDAFQMKRAVVMDYFLGKGGYIYVDKAGKRFRSLRYVSEENISFNKNPDVIFKDYDILVQGNTYKPYQFIRLLRNTKDGAEGKSIIEENALLLGVAYSSLKFEETLVSTGGNKKGFIKSARRLTDTAITTLKEAWRNLYSNNSENVVILNEGLDFKEASNTSVEMQLNENKKSNGDEICKIIGMPPSLMNGNAGEQDEKNFIKYVLTNVFAEFRTAINRAMLLESEKDTFYFDFDISELIKGDIEKRYNAYSVGIEKGFLHTDEVRRKENMPPLGMKFVKLGLQDGLYDPESKVVYVLNTNKAVNLDDLKENKGGENKGESNLEENPSSLTGMSTPYKGTADQSGTEEERNSSNRLSREPSRELSNGQQK